VPPLGKKKETKKHSAECHETKHSAQSNISRVPTLGKKKQCRGLMLACGDSNGIHAFQILLSIVQCCRQAGVPITFSPGFDHAVGSDDVRLFLTGVLDKPLFVQRINDALHTFLQNIQPFLLYTPAPRLIECQ